MCKARTSIVKCLIGGLDLTLSRDQITTVFPVTLGSPEALGIFDSSFTAMAWVYSDVSASDSGDNPIFGTARTEQNKGLHLQVSSCIKQIEFTHMSMILACKR